MKNADSRRTIVLIVAAIVLCIAAVWVTSRFGEEGTDRAVMCTNLDCGYVGVAKVGDYIEAEDWPRECPKCKTKHLYLFRVCPECHKRIPLKDPNAEKYGNPQVCPYCNKRDPYET